MKHKIELIAGWAHPGECLLPIADKLEDYYDVAVHPADLHLELEEPSVLAGWSLGGMLALQNAMRKPELVEALVMIASTPRFTFAKDSGFGVKEANLLEMMKQLQGNTKNTIGGFLAHAALPHRPKLREMLHQIETLQAGLAYLRDTDLRSGVDHVKCPVLLIHGKRDAVIPIEASEWLRHRLQKSKLISVENMGHDLPLRRPEWIAREIRFFIDAYVRP